MTLDEIKNHMYKYMVDGVQPALNSDYMNGYDDTGHCAISLWNRILIFWSKLDSNRDFIYLVSGEWATDGLDLNGGRSYILSLSNVVPLLFEYLHFNLNYSLQDYREIIYNSTELSDELQDMYLSLPAIRNQKINLIIE